MVLLIGCRVMRRPPKVQQKPKRPFKERSLGPQVKPQHVYTDNSEEFEKALNDLGLSHVTSTPHRPETNGIAERADRRVKGPNIPQGGTPHSGVKWTLRPRPQWVAARLGPGWLRIGAWLPGPCAVGPGQFARCVLICNDAFVKWLPGHKQYVGCI